MKKVLVVLIVLLKSLTIFSQEEFIKVSVYFDKDKFYLTEKAKQILDSLLIEIDNLEIKGIEIQGNTDSDASQEYNIQLSKNRCLAVRNYLQVKGIPLDKFEMEHYGEDKPIYTNLDNIGMQKNRRVDVTVKYRLAPIEVSKEEPAEDLCTEDTTILMPSGSMFVFNKCEYLEKADCFTIEEYFNSAALAENNLTTMDEEGNPLASGGMFGFPLKNNRCENLCFNTPVIIRYTVSENCEPCSRSSLYNIDANGNWVKEEDLKLVIVDGKYYSEVRISCLDSKINKDCKIPTKKFKFKVNKNYEILRIELSGDCPLYRYNTEPKTKRTNIINFNKKKLYGLPCFVNGGNFQATLVDKNTNDTLYVELQPLVNIKNKGLYSKCGRKKIKKILRFTYKKKIRKKYKIRKIDMVTDKKTS